MLCLYMENTFNGVITNIEHHPQTDNITIDSECTQNKTGINGKLPNCNFTIRKNLNINGDNIQNPLQIITSEDNGFIKLLINTPIDGVPTNCFIEFKTYDITESSNSAESETVDFPYIGRYFDLIQYLGERNKKIVRKFFPPQLLIYRTHG